MVLCCIFILRFILNNHSVKYLQNHVLTVTGCSCLNRSAAKFLCVYSVCDIIAWGHAVAQSVEALRYKLEGCGFDSRWCHWNFSWGIIRLDALWSWG